MTESEKRGGLAEAGGRGLVGNDDQALPPAAAAAAAATAAPGASASAALRKLLLDPEQIRSAHIDLKAGRFRRTLELLGLDDRRAELLDGSLPPAVVAEALAATVAFLDQQQRSNKPHLKLETLKRDAGSFQAWLDGIRKIAARSAGAPEEAAADLRAQIDAEEHRADEAAAQETLKTFAAVGVTWDVWQQLSLRFAHRLSEARLLELAREAFGATWQPPAPSSELEELRKWAQWMKSDESYRIFAASGHAPDVVEQARGLRDRWFAAEARAPELGPLREEPMVATWFALVEQLIAASPGDAASVLASHLSAERRRRFHRDMIAAVRKRHDDDGVIDFGEWSYLKGRAEELLEDDRQTAVSWAIDICREVTGLPDWSPPVADSSPNLGPQAETRGSQPDLPPSSRRILPSFDWVTTLHAVHQRIGLQRIDEGIEGAVKVHREHLPSSRTHAAVAHQRLGIEQQLLQMRSQEVALQHDAMRMRAMQHGPGMMQVQAQQQRIAYDRHQLEVHHHQLGVQLQRLDIDIEREHREAVENELLKMFVDLHELVKTAFHAGRSADAFLFIVVTERVYTQVRHVAQSPHSRLALSSVRDANVASLATLMGSEPARRAIRECFEGGCAPYVELMSRAREADAALMTTLAEYNQNNRVCLAGPRLADASNESRAYASRLAACRQALGSLHEERRRLADDRYLRELLLVPCGRVNADALRRFTTELGELQTAVAASLGMPLLAFEDEALTLDGRLASRIAEASRVLGLVDLVFARQYFVGSLAPLHDWHEHVAAELSQLTATAASLTRPIAAAQTDIQAYVRISVLLAQARRSTDGLRAGTERNRALADPAFIHAVPALFHGLCSPDADVVPSCQGVAHRFGVLRAVGQELLDRAGQLSKEAGEWKSRALSTEPMCDALVAEIASSVTPGMDEAIGAGVKIKLSTLGTKIVTALTTAKSAERKQRQAYLEVALQKLSDAALPPPAPREAPALVVPA